MDINKEREAIKNLKAFYMEDWNLTEEERDDLDNLVSRIVAVVKTEAQAVLEGFVLVPKEPHADLVNHGHQVFLGHFNEGGQTGGRSLYFAYKAMIEAQEPADD